MRLGAAVLLVIATLPPAVAQAGSSGGGQVLEETAGDVQFVTPVGSQAAPAGHFQALDLLGLRVEEVEDGFSFIVAVAGLDKAPEVPAADDSLYAITFAHNDQAYRIVMLRALGDQSYYWGVLLKYDPAGNTDFQRVLTVAGDGAAGTIATHVLREDLQDRHGAAPFPGRSLSNFWVETHLRSSQGGFLNVAGVQPTNDYDATDRMPDAGNGTTALPVRFGLAQSGHSALWSPDPIRASNGEQATFVFNITGQNTGDQEELFDFRVAGAAPDGWQVTLPASTVRIGAGQTVGLPVLVSTPFGHIHGALKKFRLELTSQADAGSVGRLDIGIRYFAVPQPAGHHPTLAFHSQTFGSQSPLFDAIELGFSGNSGIAYMNTLNPDPDDALAKITGEYWGFGCRDTCAPPTSEWHWTVWLQPALLMGLDFDLAGSIDVQAPFESRVPIPQSQVSGWLFHYAYDESRGDWVQTTVATLPASDPVDLEAGVPHLFSWKASPAAQADLLPYAKRAYFGLMLNLTTVKPSLFTGAEAPMLDPGGLMNLPLFEYRDPISESLQSIGAVRLEALGPRERPVNPGKAALFSVRLVNDLDHDQSFLLNLTGVHSGWAELFGPTEVRVAARSAVELHIGVRVPESAVQRDTADVVLSAADSSDPSVRALIRLLAVVDTAGAQPDDATQLDAYRTAPAHGSPWMPVGVPAILLAALACWRRREPRK